MTETQQRFLKAIAERISGDRVVEVRLFPPIRQGQMESAVAIVAVEGLDPPNGEREVPLDATPGDVSLADVRVSSDLSAADDSVIADAGASDRVPSVPHTSASRFSIVTARYRLTIKGPDRGKWEFELVHDADAPLDAVERVVRGVAHRVGEGGEPDLLSRADFQRAVTEPWFVADRESGIGNR